MFKRTGTVMAQAEICQEGSFHRHCSSKIGKETIYTSIIRILIAFIEFPKDSIPFLPNDCYHAIADSLLHKIQQIVTGLEPRTSRLETCHELRVSASNTRDNFNFRCGNPEVKYLSMTTTGLRRPSFPAEPIPES